MFCNQCGHRNPAGSNFCASCGAVLSVGDDTTITFLTVEASSDVAEEELSVHVDELTGDIGLLVVKRGPNAGAKFTLDQEVTKAGRHPDSDIFLDDITVSRRHADVVRVAGGYRVRDVGSLNGTYVNRERIDDVPLTNGDEVQIGKFKLVFFAAADGGAGGA